MDIGNITNYVTKIPMASIHLKPKCKYYYAYWRLPNGKLQSRSTKLTNKAEAKRLAEIWEEETHSTKPVAQTMKVLSDMRERTAREALTIPTASTYATDWLLQKKPEVATATYHSYDQVLKELLDSLGKRSEEPIYSIGRADIMKWRTEQSQRKGSSTVNGQLKVLKIFFNSAEDAGYITENPASKVSQLRQSDAAVKRRAFTMEELKQVLAHAEGEWPIIILCGYYTGQRLGDIVTLKWSSVNFQANEIQFITKKTKAQVQIPIMSQLRNALQSIPQPRDTYVFPIAQATFQKSKNRVNTLSNQFAAIVAKAGLRVKVRHRKKDRDSSNPLSKTRDNSELTFHSLRYTTTSFLKRSGSANSIAQDIIGHDSPAISNSYTNIDHETKRKALGGLPRLVMPKNAKGLNYASRKSKPRLHPFSTL